MNHSMQFKQASEIISDVIFLDSEGIFLIDLTDTSYITLKASPLVRKVIRSCGSYYELLGRLLDPDDQNLSPRFRPFLDLNIKKGNCYFRDTYILQDDRKVYMKMFLFPSSDKKSAVITLSSAMEFTYEDYLEKFKNKVIGEIFLYSMIVDLDRDACRDCYVSEITMSGQNNTDISYSAWRAMLSENISENDRAFFLQQTEPEYVRSCLENAKYVSFKIRMFNLSGTAIWARHSIIRIKDLEKKNLYFLYTVQDISEEKSLNAGVDVKMPGYSIDPESDESEDDKKKKRSAARRRCTAKNRVLHPEAQQPKQVIIIRCRSGSDAAD